MSVAPDASAALWTRDLSKHFGAQTALRGVSLAVPAGSFLVLLGPNGAGKTTLLRIIAGLTHPSGGEVRVLGEPPASRGARARGSIGLVTHRPQLYADLSAEENLRFFGALYGLGDLEARVSGVLQRVELASRRADPVRSYSQGMTQRLSIARALLHDPEVILLDEPTTGLDDRAIGILTDLLSSLHDGTRTLLMTTHRTEVGLGVADRVAALASGRIVFEGDARGLDATSLRERIASAGGAA